MAEKFIKKAIKHPGALRRALGIKKGETISKSLLKRLATQKTKAGKDTLMAKRARLALTLGKLRDK